MKGKYWCQYYSLHSIRLALYGAAGLLLAPQVSAPTKITAGYGGELGYQAPIWIAHELKLFAKHGMTSELVRIAGGARSTAALLANALQLSQSAGVAPVQANLGGRRSRHHCDFDQSADGEHRRPTEDG